MPQYYDNIDNCPLFIFRDIIIKGDYKLLLKPKNSLSGYDEDKAKEIWANIYDDYDDIIESKSVNILFELNKQVIYLANEYDLFNNYLFMIVEGTRTNIMGEGDIINIDYYIKQLNNNNYRFEKSKGIGNEVTRISKQLKNYETRITQIREKINKLNETNKNWTIRDTIESVIVFRGVGFDKETTVYDFATALNGLIKSRDHQKDKK